jgi:predicted small lipoprotein YifL
MVSAKQDNFMPKASYSHRKWMAALLLVLASSSFLLTGCGKKGPPRPPRRPLPPAVKDLAYIVHNDIVELRWTVPSKEENRSAALPAAVKVFRSRLSAEEANCENCPIRFTASSDDIPIHRKGSEKSKPIRMSYSEFVEPGYRYIYKVTVFDEYGIGSKDSNIVKFDHYSD